MADLEGKVAIVTGAASFVGEAIGAALIGAGATVVLADRDVERGSAAAARLGDAARFVATDVADDAQLDLLVAAAVGEAGRLEVLVSAGGWGLRLALVAIYERRPCSPPLSAGSNCVSLVTSKSLRR